MNLDGFKLLADENIHPQVSRFLRRRGFDVLVVTEEGLVGATDLDLLRRAVSENRVILTHDRDFGTLAALAGEPIVGIVYLRPGHIDPTFTIESLNTLFEGQHNLSPPFIVVLHRKNNRLHTRVRQL